MAGFVMPGLSRLRGRSRFGGAKARASTFFRTAGKAVDGRDKPGHDGHPGHTIPLLSGLIIPALDGRAGRWLIAS
ncbi:hypothetical protein XH88_01130 [Bradyrhizobium sp. CCBAU 51627]|nr:hypothetical protein [Bradyrhizobium sp. CCBAU 51627]